MWSLSNDCKNERNSLLKVRIFGQLFFVKKKKRNRKNELPEITRAENDMGKKSEKKMTNILNIYFFSFFITQSQLLCFPFKAFFFFFFFSVHLFSSSFSLACLILSSPFAYDLHSVSSNFLFYFYSFILQNSALNLTFNKIYF